MNCQIIHGLVLIARINLKRWKSSNTSKKKYSSELSRKQNELDHFEFFAPNETCIAPFWDFAVIIVKIDVRIVELLDSIRIGLID